MCATCGCDRADDDHGDDFNIRWSQIEDAAYAAEIDIDEVMRNLRATWLSRQREPGMRRVVEQHRPAAEL